MNTEIISQEEIATRIYFIRGKRVIIDNDLAFLYGVDTKQLNRQVRRNIDRFPADCVPRAYKKDQKEVHFVKTFEYGAV